MNRFGCNKVKHTDSTDLPVCSIRKAKNHKTMERLASWSKSSKGWFYGLKLHLSVDLLGRVVGLYFTTGNASDREVLKTMNKDLRGNLWLTPGTCRHSSNGSSSSRTKGGSLPAPGAT